MRRLAVSVVFLAAVGALGAVIACGPGNDKPPLTPDGDHPGLEDGGAPATPATPAPPAK